MIFIATIGRNPLPIVIAAAAFRKKVPDLRVWLVATSGTSQEATRVKTLLQSDTIDISNVEVLQVSVSESEIARVLAGAYQRAPGGGRLHLHYTGGYKLLGFGVEDAAKQLDAQLTTSYLDADTYALESDSAEIDELSILPQEIHISLKDLVALHGWTMDFEMHRGPQLPPRRLISDRTRGLKAGEEERNPLLLNEPLDQRADVSKSEKFERNAYDLIRQAYPGDSVAWSAVFAPLGGSSNNRMAGFEVDVLHLQGCQLTLLSCSLDPAKPLKTAEAVFRAKQLGGEATRSAFVTTRPDVAAPMAEELSDIRDLRDSDFRVIGVEAINSFLADRAPRVASKPTPALDPIAIPADHTLFVTIVGGSRLPAYLGLEDVHRTEQNVTVLYVHTEESAEEARCLAAHFPGHQWKVPGIGLRPAERILAEWAARQATKKIIVDYTGGKKNIAHMVRRALTPLQPFWRYLDATTQSVVTATGERKEDMRRTSTLDMTKVAELHGFSIASGAHRVYPEADALFAEFGKLGVPAFRAPEIVRQKSGRSFSLQLLASLGYQLIGIAGDEGEAVMNRGQRKVVMMELLLRMRQMSGPSGTLLYLTSGNTRGLTAELADFSGTHANAITIWGPGEMRKLSHSLRQYLQTLNWKI